MGIGPGYFAQLEIRGKELHRRTGYPDGTTADLGSTVVSGHAAILKETGGAVHLYTISEDGLTIHHEYMDATDKRVQRTFNRIR